MRVMRSREAHGQDSVGLVVRPVIGDADAKEFEHLNV